MLTKYVRATFHNGTALRPVPPVESKYADVRYFHIHEDYDVDQAQFTAWVERASKIPGEMLF